MFPLERQKKIIELLTIHKVLKLAYLTNELDVSIETLRRDIHVLTGEGKVEKIYGGIKLIATNVGESALDIRMSSHLKEKEMIAQKCSESIQDGDCIYLDSGSTTYQIAKYIQHKKNLTVVTNSIPIINELLTSDVELIMIGGKVRKSEHSITTSDFLFNLNEINILKAFICASGISIEKGISDYSLEEAITRRNIIALAKEVYVAVDHTKFSKDVTIGIAPLSEIDYIVTDHSLSPDTIRQFEQANAVLICAEP